MSLPKAALANDTLAICYVTVEQVEFVEELIQPDRLRIRILM
jgi:hypothetical protein